MSELKPSLDSSFRGSNPLEHEIMVKVQQIDIEKLDNIWNDELTVDLEAVDKNHYIFEFTNEELFDILARPDEWSPSDYKLSIALLKKRGKNIDKDLIESLKKQRLKDLSKTESSQTPWIILGYFVSVLGGIIAIAIGWHLMSSKKTLPNGTKSFSYRDSDRKHGSLIFYIGIFFTVFWISVRMISEVI